MSFPGQQPPYAQHQPQVTAPAPYRASTRSRIIVWTIAAILATPAIAIAGYFVYAAVWAVPKGMAQDDKILGTCHQEARRHLGRGSDQANFYREKVAHPSDSRAEAFGTVDFGGTRQQYTCVVYVDGNVLTLQEFRLD